MILAQIHPMITGDQVSRIFQYQWGSGIWYWYEAGSLGPQYARYTDIWDQAVTAW